MNIKTKLKDLSSTISGELHTDYLTRTLYSTDASVYKMMPTAVCYPKNTDDIRQLILFARQHQVSLIPRTAGTSLAGQCVGHGIVIDLSKHFTKIISFNKAEKSVIVQPGVIRDQLNLYLKQHGLFFSPNTSTSNFCMIGGMVGNNSCGTTSIRYGVTRDKVISLDVLLSDGHLVRFKDLSDKELIQKKSQKTLEGKIHRFLIQRLSRRSVKNQILRGYPSQKIHRRNTGYAVDELIRQRPFELEGDPFNLCSLITGSEGTLGIVTQIELRLDNLPPEHNGMVIAHFDSVIKALKAVQAVMKHQLYGCELVDKNILDCTKNHPLHQKNRFFINGDPQAILMLEVRSHTEEDLQSKIDQLNSTLGEIGLSYADVALTGSDVDAAISLRVSGLGLLGNIVGDKKSAACIEDTAVSLDVLPHYIEDFQEIARKFNQQIVYYAHAGAGELHLRPLLNLKTNQGRKEFRNLTKQVAQLVNRYNGSLSGEHGDGIVRSEFIPLVLGEKNYSLLWEIKQCFDPQNIFNPGKIVDSFPMDKNLRFDYEQDHSSIQTKFDFSDDKGLLRSLERCNGAGNCRSIGPSGVLCPSYRATRDEVHTTRGRANVLREALGNPLTLNPFDSKEAKVVLDLCLSCKACISECPSSVDMATYKAEFTYQYNKLNGIRLRDRLFAHYTNVNKRIRPIRWLYNTLINNSLISGIMKRSMGISPERSLPNLYRKPRFTKFEAGENSTKKTVCLYIDEFTYFNEPHIAHHAYELLILLGYNVIVLPFRESGRTFISKGLLDQAQKRLEVIFDEYAPIMGRDKVLIGIEPSAVYTFRDELPKILKKSDQLISFSRRCELIDTFLANEYREGNIGSSFFSNENRTVKFHAHCYQKALGSVVDTFEILNLPQNYQVTILNTGCCGMAGSFGYEKEHYDISMKIGQDRLFPAIESSSDEVIIAANGTSCRHQIFDGTGRKSSHPVSILWQDITKKTSLK
ncbi:MAG: FAD-binding protein [Flavobacteriaceae bacterium]|nr:FAD-binding protein [Flavobacteriaceae bacterium]